MWIVAWAPVEKREWVERAIEWREARAGRGGGAQLEAEQVDERQQDARALRVPQHPLARVTSAALRLRPDSTTPGRSANVIAHSSAKLIAHLRPQRRDCAPEAEQSAVVGEWHSEHLSND